MIAPTKSRENDKIAVIKMERTILVNPLNRAKIRDINFIPCLWGVRETINFRSC